MYRGELRELFNILVSMYRGEVRELFNILVSMYRGEVAELFNILQSYFSFHVPRRSSRTLQFLGQGSRSKLLGQVRVNRFIESGGGRGVKGYNSRVTKIGGGWRGGKTL